MSSASPVQNGQHTEMWNYITHPIAGTAAIIPVFYGFVAKSAQQQGNPIPKMTVMEALEGGCRAAPSLGMGIGLQMIAENLTETKLRKITKNSGEPTLTEIGISAAFVGVLSAAPLAAFNRKTMKGVTGSLTLRELGVTAFREAGFLLSIRASDPVSKMMKKRFGNNKAVEYGSAFMTGAAGSVTTHPADTALTLWQKGRPMVGLLHCMRGAPVKAISVGSFAVLYNIAKKILNNPS